MADLPDVDIEDADWVRTYDHVMGHDREVIHVGDLVILGATDRYRTSVWQVPMAPRRDISLDDIRDVIAAPGGLYRDALAIARQLGTSRATVERVLAESGTGLRRLRALQKVEGLVRVSEPRQPR